MTSRHNTSYEHEPAREDGMEQCVRCGELFGGERASMEVNYTSGPVVNPENGTEYDVVVDSPPGSSLMHPECYKEHQAEVNASEHKQLGEFV